MIHATTGEAEARGDIRGIEIGQLREDLLQREPGGQEIEDVNDTDAHSAHARTPATLLRIDGDAIHQLDRVAHDASLLGQKSLDHNILPNYEAGCNITT